MSDLQTNYPGIRQIVRFPFNRTPRNCELMAVGKQKVILPFSQKTVSFFGVPILTATTKVENNGTLSEAKLTFKTNEDLPFFGWNYAVMLEDHRCFMIGSDGRLPVVQRVTNSGSPDGEAKVRTYEISMKAAITPIECYI